MTKLLFIAIGFGLNRLVDNSTLRSKVIAKFFEATEVVKKGMKDGVERAKVEIEKAKAAAEKNSK